MFDVGVTRKRDRFSSDARHRVDQLGRKLLPPQTINC
jgi:hypothetical protein